MHNEKRFLAVIPARGGSKRLPKKNILDLNGKPLIAHTIEAANESQYIDKVVVSSDDEVILDIANKFNASILKRPSELASDTSTTFDAIKHVIQSLEEYDYIVLLQPTSPLRQTYHIDEAIELLELKSADAIVSVTKMEHSPLWSNTLPENGDMKNFIRSDVKNIRSQDLEEYYRLNGAIYICDVQKLLEEKTFILSNEIYAYIMNRDSSIDIDEKLDFELAKCIMNMKA